MSLTTPVLPPNADLPAIVRTVNNVLRGKTNNTASVTLTANAASTVLTDIRIGINSVILLQPTTANAAGALATTYFGTPGDGTVTITHANNAQADKTFKYAIAG
jgi:hypothetical protein